MLDCLIVLATASRVFIFCVALLWLVLCVQDLYFDSDIPYENAITDF